MRKMSPHPNPSKVCCWFFYCAIIFPLGTTAQLDWKQLGLVGAKVMTNWERTDSEIVEIPGADVQESIKITQ